MYTKFAVVVLFLSCVVNFVSAQSADSTKIDAVIITVVTDETDSTSVTEVWEQKGETKKLIRRITTERYNLQNLTFDWTIVCNKETVGNAVKIGESWFVKLGENNTKFVTNKELALAGYTFVKRSHPVVNK